MAEDVSNEVLTDAKAESEIQNVGSLLSDIDSLVEQTLQIHELTSKESQIIESIGSSISILLNELKTSLQLPFSIFDKEYPAIKSAILNNNGDIIIMQGNGNIITKKFTELDGTQIIHVMKAIVPKLDENAYAVKVEITDKIGVLTKVAKQLQRVQTHFSPKRSSTTLHPME